MKRFEVSVSDGESARCNEWGAAAHEAGECTESGVAMIGWSQRIDLLLREKNDLVAQLKAQAESKSEAEAMYPEHCVVSEVMRC